MCLSSFKFDGPPYPPCTVGLLYWLGKENVTFQSCSALMDQGTWYHKGWDQRNEERRGGTGSVGPRRVNEPER